MGVKQLTSYIEQHHDVLFKEHLRMDGQKIVFDGGCLYYGLSRGAPKCFGGDYDGLYINFCNFFMKLKKLNITSYVVLDGGSNLPLKADTTCERLQRDVGRLSDLADLVPSQEPDNLPKPLLTKCLFIQVLEELGVEYVVAKNEADLLTAAIANRFGCPVVTSDSDFYLTNVLYGVVTLESVFELVNGYNECLSERYNKCSCFKTKFLAEHLRVKEEFLPFVGIIMGCDYSTGAHLKSIQETCRVRVNNRIILLYPRMQRIAEYLRQFETTESVVEHFCSFADARSRESLRNEIRKILQEFDVRFAHEECERVFPFLVRDQSTVLPAAGMATVKSVESVIVPLLHQGLLRAASVDIYYEKCHFVNVQCEDTASKSSSHLSLELRKYIYTSLLAKSAEDTIELNEYNRFGNDYRQIKVRFCVSELKKMPFDILTKSYTENEKRNVLCEITRFPTQPVNDGERDSFLFLLSVRYWILKTSESGEKLKIGHIYALLISFIRPVTSKVEKADVENKTLDLTLAHHYCQWQSIVYYLIMLNDLFLRPLKPILIKSVFNGSYAHYIYRRLIQGEFPNTLVPKEEQRRFESLAKFLNLAEIQDMDEHICYETLRHTETRSAKTRSATKSAGKPRKQELSKRTKEEQKKSGVNCSLNNSGNRFAALMNFDEDGSVDSEGSDS